MQNGIKHDYSVRNRAVLVWNVLFLTFLIIFLGTTEAKPFRFALYILLGIFVGLNIWAVLTGAGVTDIEVVWRARKYWDAWTSDEVFDE